jgi:hypothetical protein
MQQLIGRMHNWRGILFVAFLARIVAVIFSPGYGMHDDHFLIIESSASWVDGYDYNNWLPWSPNNAGHPEGHSFTYVGLNFFYFYTMKMLGIADPKVLMFINRLLHAFASMAVVHFGMRITEKLSDRVTALRVGWFLALLWILPFVSVRNLVEMVAAPLLVYGTWLILKSERRRNFLFSGMVIGLSVSFRYQVGVFAIGMGLYFLFTRRWIPLLLFSLGNALVFGLTQGLVDYLIWGYPFAELMGYVTYNLKEGTQYLPNQNYLMYFLVLTGCFFVPLGLILGFGFFRSARKYAVLFVPTFAFLLFHTIYPNRQERFILSILPFFLILGVLGYQLLKETPFKQKIWRISLISFWVLNIPFLLFASTMYSKRSRVEAMYSLYGKKEKIDLILLEGSASGRVSMLPKFYNKCWSAAQVERTDSVADLRVNPALDYPYIFFFDEKDLDKRVLSYKKLYPKMQLEFKSYPSLVDQLLRWLNPRNANEYIEVWKTNYTPVNTVRK